MCGRSPISVLTRQKHSRKTLTLLTIPQMLREHTDRSCFSWNSTTPTLSSSKKSSGQIITGISISSSSIWTSTFTPLFEKTSSQNAIASTSSIKWPRPFIFYTQQASSIGMSNHPTYWLTKTVKQNYVILVLFGPSMIRWKIPLTFSPSISLLAGTERPKFCWALESIVKPSIFGAWGACCRK